MSYTKQNFMNGQTLKAEHLDHIENGICQLSNKMDDGIRQIYDEMANIDKPTDEQVKTAVNAWLDEHPEATTTVQDGTITNEKLSDGTITNEKLSDSAITTEKLANTSITTEKLADGTVTTEKLVDGSVTKEKLSPNLEFVLADDSVTPNKTTFFKKTTIYANLYDAVNAEKGCVKCTDDTFYTSGSNVNVYTCPAFPVTSGKSYFVGRANGTLGQDMVNNNSWAFYDADMNFVAQPSQSAMGGWNPIPDGVAYMRVSVYYTSGRDNCMVVEGTEAPDTYVSYQDGITLDMGWKDDELREVILNDAKEYIEGGLSVDGTQIKTGSVPLTANESVIEYNLNLVNPDEVEKGKNLNNSTGAVQANEYTDVTGYVPVKAGRKYFTSTKPSSVWFYDKNKHAVKNLGWTSAANQLGGFEVPADGFIRVVYLTGQSMAVNDYGMNFNARPYGTKKLVYTDENGTVFPEAVNDAGVISAFEWEKANLVDEDKYIDGNETNGVFQTVAKWGNTHGNIIDVIGGKEYVIKGSNGHEYEITQYAEDWSFVSKVSVPVDDSLGAYLGYRYTAGDNVAHIITEHNGFFAEANDTTIEVLKHLYPRFLNDNAGGKEDNLKVVYLPKNMTEAVKQLSARLMLSEQSELLQQTIHKTKGLKWNCLGDSLTTLSWGTNMYNIVSDALGLTPTNYGIVSSTIADYENDGTSGDPMCVRYTQMDADADIVTVMAGTNDYARDDKVGTMADRDKNTLYGACHVLFSGLIEKYPNARIAVILPPQNGQGVPSYVQTQGGDPDMANMRKKVNIIREVAEYYSLPVCDLFNHGGIPGILPSTIGRLLSGDYLHITPEGYKVLSKQLLPFMRDLIG